MVERSSTSVTGPGSGSVERFRRSCDRLEVPCRSVEAGDVARALRDVIETPAVGQPLSIDGTTLPVPAVVEPSRAELEGTHTGITEAVLGVADYGSVVLRRNAWAEAASLFVERHVAVLRASDLVSGLPAALRWIGADVRETSSSFVVATGPSATADMGDLVKGAHGPGEVVVIVVSDR